MSAARRNQREQDGMADRLDNPQFHRERQAESKEESEKDNAIARLAHLLG